MGGGKRIVQAGFIVEPDGGGVVAGKTLAKLGNGPDGDADREQGDHPPLHVARANGEQQRHAGDGERGGERELLQHFIEEQTAARFVDQFLEHVRDPYVSDPSYTLAMKWLKCAGLGCALTLLTLATGAQLRAAEQWYRAKLGPFEAISDNRASAIQALSQFEQFRYALGEAMGQRDLRLDPPLRILVFRDARAMAAQGCEGGIHSGRDHLMACAVASGQLPPAIVRELTRRLLEGNFTGIPPVTVTALQTFFSTVESNAVHVMWGAPPAMEERTRDWAMLHRMITQPELAGRAHIFLHNIAGGMDVAGAVRSLGTDPAAFNADVDRYFQAGVFQAVQAPNRPLSPDRDFVTSVLTADDVQLAHADLFGSDAEATYTALLQAGKHQAEANEGLGLLAMRAGDDEKAADDFAEAYKAGSRNVFAMTAYAHGERHYDVAIEVLKQALKIDPKYAPAHWELGDKFDDPALRLAEWKIALGLAPHNEKWWVSYAMLNEGQKHWAEAGRAWVAAADATGDPAKRAEYLAARGKIETQRLDDEVAEKRRADAAKAAEMDRLKSEARQEISRIEAKANAQNTKKGDNAPIVDWAVEDKSAVVTGMLTRVDCLGTQFKMSVKEAGGAVRVLLIADPNGISVAGGEMKFSCGAQTPRAVVIRYTPRKGAADGVFGEVTGIEYK